jgi:2-(1,2-epoxy-1,2-dihydrophenyl)acetyl-CoA isomerase
MSHLLKSVEDGVMKITLNRPDAMNALSRDMMNGLNDALLEAAGSRDVGCVVVRGAGDKAFCAGGDVKSMAAGRDQDKTYEDKVHEIRIRMRVSELLHEMGKPTIAMVNGVAAGAGLSLALAADMRFAGKSARMTTAFAKVGFSGDFGSHYFLHKLVGTAKARELYFTAEILNAEQIEKLGLANRVVDDANLDNETMAREEEHEGGRGGLVVRGARFGGRPHDPHRRDRGPQGSRPRLRRKAPAGVQGVLTSNFSSISHGSRLQFGTLNHGRCTAIYRAAV